MTVAFRYRAARGDGAVIDGTLAATTLAEASRRLAAEGLHPISLRLQGADSLPADRFSPRDLAAAFHGLAALTAAGVPIVRGLRGIADTVRPRIAQGLREAANGVERGELLSEAFGHLGGKIPAVVVGILRAGERSGRLGDALAEIAEHQEIEADLTARVRQALAYPLILTLVGLLSTGVITFVVIPKFAAMLSDLGATLPTSTRALLALGAFAANWWWAVLVGVVAGGVALTRALRTPAGELRAAEVLLRLPVVGEFRMAFGTARAARAAASALGAGLPVLPALRAATDAASDPAIAVRLLAVQGDLLAGAPLARSLRERKALHPVALQLIGVGEASGQLGPMFRRAGLLAGQEAERGLRSLVGLLEPALVVVFGGIVAFVAAALLQAVYALKP